MNIEASVTGKRQITIPKDLYEDMGLKNTDKLVFSKNDNGEIVVSKKEVNNLDVCPLCNREVLNKDVMVVKDSQKYHEGCWNISGNSQSDSQYIANKVTNSQIKTLNRVEEMKKEYTLDMTKKLKDNEVIITVPVKLTFMEGKPGVIGMISEFKASEIMNCNKLD